MTTREKVETVLITSGTASGMFAVIALLTLGLLLMGTPAHAQGLLGDETHPAPGTVRGERAKYGARMTPAEVAALLNAVAWAHRVEGWGMLRKGSGNSCPLGDTFISCDILIDSRGGHHFDVLMDAENAAKPVWSDVGPCVLGPSSGCEMSRFLAPIDPGGSPTVPPMPTTGGPDLGPVLARVDALEHALQALAASLPGLDQRIGAVEATGAKVDPLAEKVDALVGQVAAMAARPIPVACSAALNLGATRVPISCRLQ